MHLTMQIFHILLNILTHLMLKTSQIGKGNILMARSRACVVGALVSLFLLLKELKIDKAVIYWQELGHVVLEHLMSFSFC